GRGLMALAICSRAGQLVAAAACWYRLRHDFPHLKFQVRLSGISDLTGYMKKSGWISVSQVAQVLTMGSDLLLVGKLLGPSAAVPYSCTGKLASVLANKPQMLMQTAFPGLTELRASGAKPRIRQASFALAQAMR